MFDAFVLAAGLGTRLLPLTERTPKALVEVGGLPLLQHVAARLVEAGATRLVVNVCAHAEQVEAFLARTDLGAPVRVSREPGGPYETGGGLWAARALFRGDRPILLHNVDVLSDLPLEALLEAHRAGGALATLAVMDRPSARRLRFDRHGLQGRADERAGLLEEARPPVGEVAALAFAGVHVVAPDVPARITERGSFSILAPYLRWAASGERLLPFRVDGCRWIDVGRPADLERARRAFRPEQAPGGAPGGCA